MAGEFAESSSYGGNQGERKPSCSERNPSSWRKAREQLSNDGSRGRKEAYMRNMVKFTAASVAVAMMIGIAGCGSPNLRMEEPA